MLDHSLEGQVAGLLKSIFAGTGGLGVEVFFVLSGFLITRILLDELQAREQIDYLGFYRRRIARLMPVFFLYLLIGVGGLLLRDRPVPWGAVASAVFYVVNYYQAFTGAAANLVAHCWSLAVEEQFYFIWPLAAGLVFARRASLARALLIAVLMVWVWRWGLFIAGVSVDYLYRALDTRADHLLVGCLVAVLVRQPAWQARIERVAGRAWLAPLLVLALYASAKLDSMSPAYKYGLGFVVEPLMIGLLIPLVMLAARPGAAFSRVLNNALMVEVGRVSYGLYLFHGMVLYSVQRIVVAQTGRFDLAMLVSFAVLLALMSASFRWFEMPMRRWISGDAARRAAA